MSDIDFVIASSFHNLIMNCTFILVTGRSKGYGFVEFKHARDTSDAYNVSLLQWQYSTAQCSA